MFAQDESRFGLKTISRRKITAKGTKPIGIKQEEYENFYVYGAVEPKTGENFFLEFDVTDSECFEFFLVGLSKKYNDSINAIILDNASFHKAKKISIPENIILIFQPPYSPELNPAERVWLYLKNQLAWKLFKNIDCLQNEVENLIKELKNETIKSLTGYDYIIRSAF